MMKPPAIAFVDGIYNGILYRFSSGPELRAAFGQKVRIRAG